ncbi:hypothetical protein BGZ74_004967 [Mortierella antarctica]|nr:hypothetical protein BGZ74_004967 [Mortierella antarctica]
MAIGILDASGSFHGIANPFQILSASPQLHPMDRDLPLPTTLGPSPPYVATYRANRRSNAVAKDLHFEEDNSEFWKPCLLDACSTRLGLIIVDAVQGVLRKRGLKDSAKEMELSTKKRRLYNDLVDRKSLPPKTREEVLKNARQRSSEVPAELSTSNLVRRLNNVGGVQNWKDVVQEEFENKWEEAVRAAQMTHGADKRRQAGSSQKSSLHQPSGAEQLAVGGSSSSTLEHERSTAPLQSPVSPSGPSRSDTTAQVDCEAGSREGSHVDDFYAPPVLAAETDPDDDEDESKAGTQCIERTLSQSLQPWMLPFLDRIDDIATETQKEFTSMMRELSFLVLKAMFVVSKGDIFQEPGKQSPTMSIKLKDLAPTLQSDEIVELAPLPELFQEALQNTVGRDSHVTNEAAPGTPRQIWDRITESIKENSDTVNIKQSKGGYSRTATTMIRQLTTNVQQIWTGTTYNKMFHQLAHSIVYAHLKTINSMTPGTATAEDKGMTKLRDPPESGKKEVETKQKLSAWRRRSRILCDQLSQALGLQDNDPRRSKRITAIQHQLVQHLQRKPVPQTFKFGKLKRTTQANKESNDDEDDDEDDEADDMDNDNNDGTKDKQKAVEVHRTRTFSGRVKWLAGALRKVLESPALDVELNKNWLRKSNKLGLKDSDVTEDELNFLIRIAKLLRPFVPKRVRVEGETDTQPAPDLVILRLQVVIIATRLLRALGKPEKCMQIAPVVSTGARYALSMGVQQFQEVICNAAPGYFDAHRRDGSTISPRDIHAVMSSREGRLDYFRSFFNVDQLEKLCEQYHYKLCPRIVFNNRYSIKFLCDVLPHSDDPDCRTTYPSKSHLAERKQRQTKGSHFDRSYWEQEYLNSPYSKEQIDAAVEQQQKEVERLEVEAKVIAKAVAKAEQERANAADKVIGPWTPACRYYTRVRNRFRKAYATQQQHTEALDRAKKDLTWWKQVKVIAHSRKPPTRKTPSLTKATVDYRRFEDDAHHLDITGLLHNNEFIVSFGATDYGIKRMRETVILPRPFIEPHMNRFAVLEGLSDDQSMVEQPLHDAQGLEHQHTEPSKEVSHGQEVPLVEHLARVPKTHTITAPQISMMAHSTTNTRRRQKRLDRIANVNVQVAINSLKDPGTVPLAAKNLKDLDQALAAHRLHAPTIEAFEGSRRRLKDLHTQHRRTRQALQIVTAHERRLIIRQAYAAEAVKSSPSQGAQVSAQDGWCSQCSQHHLQHLNEKLQYVYDPVCPSNLKKVVPVLLIGNAGTGVGSFIGGIERRGGKKLRHHHMRSAVVCITSEFRTSKTCSLCLWRVTLAKSRRIVDGKLKTVRVNGAVQCHNAACPSVQKGFCIKSRDGNAALNIGLAASSTLMRPNRKTLYQFSHRPTIQPSLPSTPMPMPTSPSTSPALSGQATTTDSSTSLDKNFLDISARKEQTPVESNKAGVRDATGTPAS